MSVIFTQDKGISWFDHNIMAALNNVFLLTEGNHSQAIRYNEECFCTNCRHLRIISYTPETLGELHRIFSRVLPDEQETHLRRYHCAVLDQIAAGKAFKNNALANSGYSYLKCWLRNNEPWKNWSDKDHNRLNDKVNMANLVFDKWDIIVRHLTDDCIREVDAQSFSLGLFYEARSEAWCLNYNENHAEEKW